MLSLIASEIVKEKSIVTKSDNIQQIEVIYNSKEYLEIDDELTEDKDKLGQYLYKVKVKPDEENTQQ